jgi:nucleoside-diphosphate-sugar epimerase
VSVVETGNAFMQPLFVEDAATAFIRAALGFETRHLIYDLVGPEKITIKDLILRVAKIMEEEGFNVPKYGIQEVLVKNAPEILGLSKEEIDVMLCDVLGDFIPFIRDFQITLTPLNEAIRAAVQHAKEVGV